MDKHKKHLLGHGVIADWKLIFFGCLALTVVFVLLDLMILYSMRTGAPAPTTAMATLNVEALKRAGAYYEEKQAAFDALLTSTTTPPDPSL